jgi:hypothetical protein
MLPNGVSHVFSGLNGFASGARFASQRRASLSFHWVLRTPKHVFEPQNGPMNANADQAKGGFPFAGLNGKSCAGTSFLADLSNSRHVWSVGQTLMGCRCGEGAPAGGGRIVPRTRPHNKGVGQQDVGRPGSAVRRRICRVSPGARKGPPETLACGLPQGRGRGKRFESPEVERRPTRHPASRQGLASSPDTRITAKISSHCGDDFIQHRGYRAGVLLP